MARPASYPPPSPSKSTYVASRDESGEIVWEKMRLQRPIPCYLHPEYAAPETGACLHPICLRTALGPLNKGLLGHRLKILHSGWRLRGEDPAGILEDIALELLARYRNIDVPVSHSISSFLNAVEAVGVRQWGWACWEPDWDKGAGSVALLDSFDDLEESLTQMIGSAFDMMAVPFVNTPEKVVRNLEIAAATQGMPEAILGYLLGEVTTADLVRLGIPTGTVNYWSAKLRKSYQEGAYAPA